MTPDERNNAAEGVLRVAREIAAVDVDRALRRDLTDRALDFRGVEEEIRHLIRLAEVIAGSNLMFVPGVVLAAGHATLEDAKRQLQRLQHFDVMTLAEARRDVRGEHNATVADFQRNAGEYAGRLAELLAYMNVAAVQIDSLTEALGARERALAAASDAASALVQARETVADLDRVVGEERALLMKAEALEHASQFSEQATEHGRAGRLWLMATSACGIAILAVAAVFYVHVADASRVVDLTPTQVAQIVAGKVLLFSALISAAVWCGKVFRAHRHNYVVNRHRQNALLSFRPLIDAAGDDPETKRTVLLQATAAIFAPQHSGFASTDTDPSPTPVTEVLKVLPTLKS